MANLRNMSHIPILILVAGCSYFTLGSLIHQRIPSKQPHIVVIIADDLGWNDVGFHGANQIPTPNIDALAYHGVILNRHYVLPICTPSRTAFLTGQYPIRAGMQGFPLKGAEPRGIPLDTPLLPEYLQELGYSTHLIGKWHVGYHTINYGPTRRGFDTFFGYYNGYIQYFNHTLVEDKQLGYDLHRICDDNHVVEYRNEYMTDLITNETENIILSHNSEQPLFLQVAHLAPHASGAEEIIEVRNWEETDATLGYIKDVNRRKFASVVATLDESVGRIVDALKRADMLDNSIIVFMSDNGAQSEGFLKNYGSNYPLRGLKFSLFEGGVRGVACIYSPLIDYPFRVMDQLYHITDWLPTLYSAAGGDPNELEHLDGINMWPAIKKPTKSLRNTLLVNIDEKNSSHSAIMGCYKLVIDKSEYSGYYGDDGCDESYPEYNITKILTSLAGSAIASISPFTRDELDIIELRERLTLSCDVHTTYPSCRMRPCLFDIDNDPCESVDLSLKYPKIVRKLSAYINSYKSVLMNQTNAPLDPAGFPRNFNNTWMPWLPDDYHSISEMHFS